MSIDIQEHRGWGLRAPTAVMSWCQGYCYTHRFPSIHDKSALRAFVSFPMAPERIPGHTLGIPWVPGGSPGVRWGSLGIPRFLGGSKGLGIPKWVRFRHGRDLFASLTKSKNVETQTISQKRFATRSWGRRSSGDSKRVVFSTYICMYVRTYIYIYTYVHICIHIYVYIW